MRDTQRRKFVRNFCAWATGLSMRSFSSRRTADVIASAFPAKKRPLPSMVCLAVPLHHQTNDSQMITFQIIAACGYALRGASSRCRGQVDLGGHSMPTNVIIIGRFVLIPLSALDQASSTTKVNGHHRKAARKSGSVIGSHRQYSAALDTSFRFLRSLGNGIDRRRDFRRPKFDNADTTGLIRG